MSCATSTRRSWFPEGHTPESYLRQLTEEGIRRRWPDGIRGTLRQQIEHELELIARAALRALISSPCMTS